MRKRTIITIGIIVLVVLLMIGGCARTAAWKRAVNDIKSDWNNGLDRTITVYTANGDVIAEYKGKIDIADADGGYVKFDYNGKRYIYYNCFVETIAEI